MTRCLIGAAALLALAALGCSDDDVVGDGPLPACPAGQVRLDDGSCGPPPLCQPGEVTVEAGCEPAGLPADMPCAPGEWLRDDGDCVPAGVPTDGCAGGFVHDGDRGCEPVLPAATCPRGQLAVPGDTSCREVAPCASGTWGDIVTPSGTQFVDAAYVGGSNDGSQSAPWTTIGEAVAAATSGATVAIAAGSYAEDVVVQGKSLTLWGRCPSMVEIAGSGPQVAAVLLREGSAGSLVRGVGITGTNFGLLATAGTGVVVQEVWIYDTAARGLDVEDSIGPAELTLRDSLIENTADLGIILLNAELTIERSVVRGALPVGGQSGRGATVSNSTLRVSGSLFEGNSELGIGIFGASSLDMQASVVRDTNETAGGLFGWGIGADAVDEAGLVQLTISGSYIADSVDYGVQGRGANVSIDTTVIQGVTKGTAEARGVGIRVLDQAGIGSAVDLRTSLVSDAAAIGVQVVGSHMTAQGVALRGATDPGWGTYIAGERDTQAAASAVIDGSVAENNKDAGIFVSNADITLTNMHIADTYGITGRGIDVEDLADVGQSQVTVSATLVERSFDSALFNLGAVVTVDRCHLRDTLGDGSKGRGVETQYSTYTLQRAVTLLLGTRVENTTEFQLFVFGADIELTDSTLTTAVGTTDGLLGDGLVLESIGVNPANAIVRHSLIESSNRAAIVNFGSVVSLQDSTLRCQALDLDGELGASGIEWSFSDEGGNVCGCPEASETCKVLSTGIEPPDPLQPEP